MSPGRARAPGRPDAAAAPTAPAAPGRGRLSCRPPAPPHRTLDSPGGGGMPEDRLAERLVLARRLASEARLDRLDELLTGLRADAVTDGGVPADLEVELAVLRATALMNVERAAEAWDHLQDVQGRLAEASPAVQARFHAAAGTAAYWFGDQDSAVDEVVLALAVLAGEPPSAARALALAAAGL